METFSEQFEEARKHLINELREYFKRWDSDENLWGEGKDEEVYPGHPIHDAVVAFETVCIDEGKSRRGMPHELRESWCEFLKASRLRTGESIIWAGLFERSIESYGNRQEMSDAKDACCKQRKRDRQAEIIRKIDLIVDALNVKDPRAERRRQADEKFKQAKEEVAKRDAALSAAKQ